VPRFPIGRGALLEKGDGVHERFYYEPRMSLADPL